MTGQAGRPRPVDDVNDGRELPPNHMDEETPSSRRNSNALSRRWASSSSLRRSLNRPLLYPQNADPPACQTSPRRRAAGRRNTPPSAGHGRGRDLQDDPLPGDRNRPHDAAPVRVRRRGSRSVVRPRLALPPSPRPPRSSSSKSSNRRGGRRLTTVQRRLASGQRRALLRLSLLRPPRARRDEHGTALLTVHRSNDDRGALFFDERFRCCYHSHTCFVWDFLPLKRLGRFWMKDGR